MKIFETSRLIIRALKETDSDHYFDMMGNPNVMNMIPRKAMSRIESDIHLNNFLDPNQSKATKKVWAIEVKNGNEFIGLCAFLKNDEQEDEIAYRLREDFWGVGYGTEIAEGLISFGFKELKSEKITADVDIANEKSVRILEKFMACSKEFFNPSDKCMDRRYEILLKDWK